MNDERAEGWGRRMGGGGLDRRTIDAIDRLRLRRQQRRLGEEPERHDANSEGEKVERETERERGGEKGQRRPRPKQR